LSRPDTDRHEIPAQPTGLNQCVIDELLITGDPRSIYPAEPSPLTDSATRSWRENCGRLCARFWLVLTQLRGLCIITGRVIDEMFALEVVTWAGQGTGVWMRMILARLWA